MKIRQLVTGLTLVFTLSTAAHAGEAAAAPTSRQLELSREILRATGVEKNYDEMLRSMLLPTLTATGQPGGASETNSKALEIGSALTEALVVLKPRLLDISAEVYAQTFTEEELGQILAFHRSPAGQTLARKMPVLTRKMAEMTAREMPSLLQGVMAQICAKSECPKASRDGPVENP